MIQLLLIFSFFAMLTPKALAAITLDDCFQSAIRRSETLSEQEQSLLQAQEKERQALGSILPSLSGTATYFVQQSPSDPLTQSFFPSTQPTVRLTVSQPIFRGMREFAALRQTKDETAVQAQTLQSSLTQLLVDVTTSFYTLYGAEQEVGNLKAQIDLYEERIAELKRRARSGQSSSSETLTAQVALAATRADLKQLEGLIRTYRETFVFLTGLPRDTLLTPPPIVRHTGPLAEYLDAMEKRPDLEAQRRKIEATDETIAIARGAHFPSIDVFGNYYPVRPTGVFSEIKWDVQATLSLPIFSGGVVQSKVREAAAAKTQAELELSRIHRLAEQDVRSLYESFQSGIQQIQALEESVQLAEQNYFVLKGEYTRGLTRNIDVLQALSQLQESKRSYNRAQWRVQSDLVRLQLLSATRALPLLRK